MFKFAVVMLRLLPAAALLLWAVPASAQETEETAEERQYREEYERVTAIVKIADLTKRSDQLYQFVKDHPHSKMNDYAQANYLHVLDSLSKAEKFAQVAALAERFITLRPRAGETYYFYGAALKNLQRYPEAMNALAKSCVLKNSASRKAREFLEFVYKTQNKGSLIGVEKLIKQAEAELAR